MNDNQKLFIELDRAIGDLVVLADAYIKDRDAFQKITERLDLLSIELQKVLGVR